jgi:hypothetical protein
VFGSCSESWRLSRVFPGARTGLNSKRALGGIAPSPVSNARASRPTTHRRVPVESGADNG